MKKSLLEHKRTYCKATTREDLTFFKGARLSVTGVSIVVTMMKLASAVVLALAVLPFSTVNGQGCPSLCTNGTDPLNLEAELPVPGLGNVSCEVAASLINTLPTITSEQCTTIQAAAFLICECPLTPQANVNLPCAFCADGSLPTNMDDPIEPTVPIPLTGGEIERCGGLVALASTLSSSAEDTATCETIQSYATVCGCAAAEVATGEPEEATTVVEEETTGATAGPDGPGGPGEEEEATTVAVVPPTEPAEEETTMAGPGGDMGGPGEEADDPLIPTSSPAPSLGVAVYSSMMPTSSSSGTEMPVESVATEPPSPTSILTPFPTAEPTSAAAKSTVCGAVLGMLVAIIM